MRSDFRGHALDGAALFFQPATGVHVRVANRATAALRRRAPRVAMFGITNACNLACDYCSRDAGRPGEWTVATAAAALRGLHDAGTLEVAYGGGEPFAFRGFAELVAELDETTALAQHVTTNGTLVRAETWPRFAGRFGQVRLSLHEGAGWREAADVLAANGQRWGANVLALPGALAGLPALLDELHARGAHDVSLLSYVGPDRARHLDSGGDARLAAIIAGAPLACRLSVCFGDRVGVPTLATGDEDGDCGAGRDFVSITPDRRVQACSFQDRGLPGATAGEILDAWRGQQVALAAPSPRRGCARLRVAGDRAPPPPIAIWQAFSGNNSGECVMVATFEELAGAEAYLAALVPGWTADGAYSPAWRELFAAEGVAGPDLDARESYGDDSSPRELVGLGRAVIAIQTAADDAFPELRALAWKRGAHVVPGGIHVHDPLALVVAVKTGGDGDGERLIREAPSNAARLYRHGDVMVGVVPILERHGALATLVEVRDAMARFAGDRPYAIEVVFEEVDDAALTASRQRLGRRGADHPRLWLSFWGPDSDARARAAAAVMPADRLTLAGATVLVDPAPDRKRLAVLAYRHGATVAAFDGARLRLQATLWYEPPPATKGAKAPPPRTIDRDHAETVLRATLPPSTPLTIEWPEHRGWRPSPIVKLDTDQPGRAMTALASYAATVDAKLTLWATEIDPLGAALERVVAAARAR